LNVYALDPLADPRWPEFVRHHPDASIFHTPEWLDALRRTYGYEPVTYTTTPPARPLTNAVVLCDVRSWVTGRRLVSVPFADHCQPLIDTPAAGDAILAELQRSVDRGGRKYVELRPMRGDASVAGRLGAASAFCLHALDLTRPLDEIFRAFHKTAIQQMIRRAEREGLVRETGTSDSLVRAFYDLQVTTRRRHRLPPQPLSWFKTLIACLEDRVTFSIAFKDGRPVGGIVLLRHNTTIVHKYGASNAADHHLGAMPFLLWHAIRDGKAAGCRQLDLGRSETDQFGLVTFKDRLGAARSTMTYQRYPAPAAATSTLHRLLGHVPAASWFFACLPNSLLVTTGRLLYRHIG
jgi:GNAT acetyltransferase-like protein